MNKTEPIIKNKFNERLDTWIESNEVGIKANIILVHGFGTNKHESVGYFDDLTSALVDDSFRVIRFDFSGYGMSEGASADVCYSKHVDDLDKIINYVKDNFKEKIYILAQSMGCFVTALALPQNISKILMTGIPNSNTQFIVDRFSKRYGNKPGGKIDYAGISLLPRTSGQIQQIGQSFWRDILALKPIEQISKLAKITKLKIIHWNQDEVLGTEYLKNYDTVNGVTALWLGGDHSVSNPQDRKNFINIMLEYFNN